MVTENVRKQLADYKRHDKDLNMAKPKENGFIIETYDEEKDMRIQFNYWTCGRYFYSSTELEDGTTARKGRISEKEYMDALEIYHNA